jgi:hypothetical protein
MGALTAVTACGDSFDSAGPFTGDGIAPSKGIPPGFIDFPMVSGMGREFFLTTAGSSLQKSCSSCHADAKRGAPVFMGSTLAKSYILLSLYEGMIAPPSDSLLLQQGTHAGPDLAAEERQLVIKWLMFEAAEIEQSPGVGYSPLSPSLTEVGVCMSQLDWTANSLDSITKLQTKDGQACSACHSNGEHGVFINVDPVATLDANRQFPIINRWVKGTFESNHGRFDEFVAENDLATYSKAACDPSVFMCHPAYELPPELVTGMETFTEKTIERWSTNACSSK